VERRRRDIFPNPEEEVTRVRIFHFHFEERGVSDDKSISIKTMNFK
jgi:hypothetical protein